MAAAEVYKIGHSGPHIVYSHPSNQLQAQALSNLIAFTYRAAIEPDMSLLGCVAHCALAVLKVHLDLQLWNGKVLCKQCMVFTSKNRH